MVIDQRLHRLIARSGEYADLFEIDAKAYKLFRSGPEIPPWRMMEGRERIFHSQVSAYRRILTEDRWLAGHVAPFYGPCSIDDVLDERGHSISENYLLDCCYMMGLCDVSDGNEAKLEAIRPPARFDGNLKHLEDAIARFAALRILTHDASVFFPSDPEKFTFIDFDDADYYTEPVL